MRVAVVLRAHGMVAGLVLAFGLSGIGVLSQRKAAGSDPVAAESKAVAIVVARGGAVAYNPTGHVSKIDLADRPATDADLGALASLESLESLEMWGAEITDLGMESLSKLVSLKHLVLENTDITDAGARWLAKL